MLAAPTDCPCCSPTQYVHPATHAATQSLIQNVLSSEPPSQIGYIQVLALLADGHRATADALTRHCDSVDMNNWGCRALVSIGGHNEAQMHQVAHEDGCDGIIASASAHLEKFQDVQRHSFWALVHLGGDLAKEFDYKAPPEAMRVHRWNQAVSRHGSWVLRYYYALGEYLELVQAEGAAECMVEAINTHPGKEDVAHHSCWAIGNHAVGLKSNRPLFKELGAIDTVLTALLGAATVADVQDQGCWAIAGLALDPHNQRAIVEAGGHEALLAAMRNHKYNSQGVHLHACWGIGNLALEGVHNQEAIMKEKGHLRALQSMQIYPQDAGVQQYACWALASLAAHPLMQEVIPLHEGPRLVCEAMERHLEVPGVQQFGCWALRNMAETALNREQIRGIGGLERVVAAIAAHPTRPEVALQGSWAVARLARDEVNCKLFCEMPLTVHELIVDRMMFFHQFADLQRRKYKFVR